MNHTGIYVYTYTHNLIESISTTTTTWKRFLKMRYDKQKGVKEKLWCTYVHERSLEATEDGFEASGESLWDQGGVA